MTGPTLHPTLEEILLRFRTYPVAVSADVSKMYHGIELAEHDRDLRRFVWRPTPSDPIQDFRMTSESPHLLHSQYRLCNKRPKTWHVHESMYVDDLLAGGNTPTEALALYSNIRALLLKGRFNLCKWRSSSYVVAQAIEPTLREKLPTQTLSNCSDSPHPKALGLEWDSMSDTMSTSLNVKPNFNPTKRGIISDIAKTFDILGWISPCIITMKVLY